jgi:hypothetical protein
VLLGHGEASVRVSIASSLAMMLSDVTVIWFRLGPEHFIGSQTLMGFTRPQFSSVASAMHAYSFSC